MPDFGISCGHTEYSNIRFVDETRHMVIFEVLCILPELEAYLLLLLTGIKAYHAKRNLSSVYSSYCFCSVYCFTSTACKQSH